MEAKKIKDFVVPFLLTVAAVVVGLGVHGSSQKHFAKTAKKASAKKEATTTEEEKVV
jgi:hypothetical protein